MKELALNILDIVQNSIRAKAQNIGIEILESEAGNFMNIAITDDGLGIPKEMLNRVTDPYTTSRTTRKVGMGLAFLRQHAELAGGKIKIDSREGKGTRVEADFVLDHIDRQPLGDMAGVLKILIMANQNISFSYHHKTDKGEYRISTKEIKEVLDIKELKDNSIMEEIRNLIMENLRMIGVKDMCFGEFECG